MRHWTRGGEHRTPAPTFRLRHHAGADRLAADRGRHGGGAGE